MDIYCSEYAWRWDKTTEAEKRGVYTTPFSTKSENLFMRPDRSFTWQHRFGSLKTQTGFQNGFQSAHFLKTILFLYIIVI